MYAALMLNGVRMAWNTEDATGQIVIRVARSHIEEGALSDWLRGR